MTFDEAEAARRRAVTMFKNFGDDVSVSEFEDMTAAAYAERKGIEIINSNPRQQEKLKMSLTNKDHEQLVGYIGSITEEALTSNSRADMRATLEEISDLTDKDVVLVFNADGTVEVEAEIESSDADDDEDSTGTSDGDDEDDDDE